MRNRTENQIRLVFIRHGATLANEQRRYLGKTDEELSEKGIDMLREACRRQAYPPVDCLFVSPMRRCRETAGILYPAVVPIGIPEWEEIDFGAFEGKNYTQLQGDERYQAWIDSGGTLPFPEGESRETFMQRCCQGFQRMTGELLQRIGEEPGFGITAGCIVHGGTIMSLLSRYGGGEYFDYQVKNGSGYRCRLSGAPGAWELVEITKLEEL